MALSHALTPLVYSTLMKERKDGKVMDGINDEEP